MFESYFLELVQGYFLYKYLSMGLLNYMSDDKEEKQAGAEPFLLFLGGGGQSGSNYWVMWTLFKMANK